MRKEHISPAPGLRRTVGSTVPLILATELLKLPGLQRTGCLLLVQQSQAVDALLHHGYLRICPEEGRTEES